MTASMKVKNTFVPSGRNEADICDYYQGEHILNDDSNIPLEKDLETYHQKDTQNSLYSEICADDTISYKPEKCCYSNNVTNPHGCGYVPDGSNVGNELNDSSIIGSSPNNEEAVVECNSHSSSSEYLKRNLHLNSLKNHHQTDDKVPMFCESDMFGFNDRSFNEATTQLRDNNTMDITRFRPIYDMDIDGSFIGKNSCNDYGWNSTMDQINPYFHWANQSVIGALNTTDVFNINENFVSGMYCPQPMVHEEQFNNTITNFEAEAITKDQKEMQPGGLLSNLEETINDSVVKNYCNTVYADVKGITQQTENMIDNSNIIDFSSELLPSVRKDMDDRMDETVSIKRSFVDDTDVKVGELVVNLTKEECKEGLEAVNCKEDVNIDESFLNIDDNIVMEIPDNVEDTIDCIDAQRVKTHIYINGNNTNWSDWCDSEQDNEDKPCHVVCGEDLSKCGSESDRYYAIEPTVTLHYKPTVDNNVTELHVNEHLKVNTGNNADFQSHVNQGYSIDGRSLDEQGLCPNVEINAENTGFNFCKKKSVYNEMQCLSNDKKHINVNDSLVAEGQNQQNLTGNDYCDLYCRMPNHNAEIVPFPKLNIGDTNVAMNNQNNTLNPNSLPLPRTSSASQCCSLEQTNCGSSMTDCAFNVAVGSSTVVAEDVTTHDAPSAVTVSCINAATMSLVDVIHSAASTPLTTTAPMNKEHNSSKSPSVSTSTGNIFPTVITMPSFSALNMAHVPAVSSVETASFNQVPKIKTDSVLTAPVNILPASTTVSSCNSLDVKILPALSTLPLVDKSIVNKVSRTTTINTTVNKAGIMSTIKTAPINIAPAAKIFSRNSAVQFTPTITMSSINTAPVYVIPTSTTITNTVPLIIKPVTVTVSSSSAPVVTKAVYHTPQVIPVQDLYGMPKVDYSSLFKTPNILCIATKNVGGKLEGNNTVINPMLGVEWVINGSLQNWPHPPQPTRVIAPIAALVKVTDATSMSKELSRLCAKAGDINGNQSFLHLGSLNNNVAQPVITSTNIAADPTGFTVKVGCSRKRDTNSQTAETSNTQCTKSTKRNNIPSKATPSRYPNGTFSKNLPCTQSNGRNTVTTAAPCNQPTGAYTSTTAALCTQPTGAYTITTAAPCTQPNGAYTITTAAPCTQPTGAYTITTSAPCTQPTGAYTITTSVLCTQPTGTYTSTTAAPSTQPTGTYTTTTAAPCTQPNGAYTITTAAPCSQPTGAYTITTSALCTQPTGACTTTTAAPCNQLTGAYTITTAAPCTQPTGACTITTAALCTPPIGACTTTTAAPCNQLTGAYTITTSALCTQPTGACTITTAAACTQPSGACTTTTTAPCTQPASGYTFIQISSKGTNMNVNNSNASITNNQFIDTKNVKGGSFLKIVPKPSVVPQGHMTNMNQLTSTGAKIQTSTYAKRNACHTIPRSSSVKTVGRKPRKSVRRNSTSVTDVAYKSTESTPVTTSSQGLAAVNYSDNLAERLRLTKWRLKCLTTSFPNNEHLQNLCDKFNEESDQLEKKKKEISEKNLQEEAVLMLNVVYDNHQHRLIDQVVEKLEIHQQSVSPIGHSISSSVPNLNEKTKHSEFKKCNPEAATIGARESVKRKLFDTDLNDSKDVSCDTLSNDNSGIGLYLRCNENFTDIDCELSNGSDKLGNSEGLQRTNILCNADINDNRNSSGCEELTDKTNCHNQAMNLTIHSNNGHENENKKFKNNDYPVSSPKVESDRLSKEFTPVVNTSAVGSFRHISIDETDSDTVYQAAPTVNNELPEVNNTKWPVRSKSANSTKIMKGKTPTEKKNKPRSLSMSLNTYSTENVRKCRRRVKSESGLCWRPIADCHDKKSADINTLECGSETMGNNSFGNKQYEGNKFVKSYSFIPKTGGNHFAALKGDKNAAGFSVDNSDVTGIRDGVVMALSDVSSSGSHSDAQTDDNTITNTHCNNQYIGNFGQQWSSGDSLYPTFNQDGNMYNMVNHSSNLTAPNILGNISNVPTNKDFSPPAINIEPTGLRRPNSAFDNTNYSSISNESYNLGQMDDSKLTYGFNQVSSNQMSRYHTDPSWYHNHFNNEVTQFDSQMQNVIHNNRELYMFDSCYSNKYKSCLATNQYCQSYLSRVENTQSAYYQEDNEWVYHRDSNNNNVCPMAAAQGQGETVEVKSSCEFYMVKKETLVQKKLVSSGVQGTQMVHCAYGESYEGTYGDIGDTDGGADVKQIELKLKSELNSLLTKISDCGRTNDKVSHDKHCEGDLCTNLWCRKHGLRDSNLRRQNLKRGLLPKLAIRIMERWYQQNIKHPYPSQETAQVIADSGGISMEQVKKWFANKRMRNGNTKKVQSNPKTKRPFEELENIAKKLKMEENYGNDINIVDTNSTVALSQPYNGCGMILDNDNYESL